MVRRGFTPFVVGEPLCSPFGWFSVHGVGARVRRCESVSLPFAWFKVYGVGAIGPCGTWFSVRVVCGGVLVLSLYSRLHLVSSCLVVIVITNYHLRPSPLYHSCLFWIVEIDLRVVVVISFVALGHV